MNIARKSKLIFQTKMEFGLYKHSFWVLINLLCVCFVFYKSWECVLKYIESHKGTTLSIETSGKHQFPGVTVCASEKSIQYNDDILKNCGING